MWRSRYPCFSYTNHTLAKKLGGILGLDLMGLGSGYCSKVSTWGLNKVYRWYHWMSFALMDFVKRTSSSTSLTSRISQSKKRVSNDTYITSYLSSSDAKFPWDMRLYWLRERAAAPNRVPTASSVRRNIFLSEPASALAPESRIPWTNSIQALKVHVCRPWCSHGYRMVLTTQRESVGRVHNEVWATGRSSRHSIK